MAAAFQLIEDEFLEGPWVMGEEYSVAINLFTLTTGSRVVGLIQTSLKSQRHHNRMLERRRSKPFCLVSAQIRKGISSYLARDSVCDAHRSLTLSSLPIFLASSTKTQRPLVSYQDLFSRDPNLVFLQYQV